MSFLFNWKSLGLLMHMNALDNTEAVHLGINVEIEEMEETA